MNQAQPTTVTSRKTDAPSQNHKPVTAADSDQPVTFWRSWRWWLPPAIVALAFVLYFVDPFIGDWDGLDYTMLSIAGYPSSMALGRNLFIFGNHFLFRLAQALFGLQPEHAYLVFKYAVVAQAPIAVAASWLLARDVTRSIYSATLAAAMVALSPVFVLYGGQVMTDVPSVWLLAIALIIHLRGVQQDRPSLIMLGAAILGLGMNLRETFAFFAPWLVLAPLFLGRKVGRRELMWIALSCLTFLALGFGWFLYWFVTDDHYQRIWFGWRESLADESARHPVTASNLWPYLIYFCVTAPLMFLSLPFALISEWRRRRMSALLLLALVGLFADILLFFNYSTAVNWRYFLTGLPALVPISSDFLVRKLRSVLGHEHLAFAGCLVVLFVIGIVFAIYSRPVSRDFIERRALSKEYRHQLVHVPRDAIMISGAQTIAVTYWKSMGLGEWKTIGTGGGWPGASLVPQIEGHLLGGKRVFLDTDPRWWLPCGWQREEISSIVGLQAHFRFRRVTETIYELRPQEDSTAIDNPPLEKLLPENRPEETGRCAPGRG